MKGPAVEEVSDGRRSRRKDLPIGLGDRGMETNEPIRQRFDGGSAFAGVGGEGQTHFFLSV